MRSFDDFHPTRHQLLVKSCKIKGNETRPSQTVKPMQTVDDAWPEALKKKKKIKVIIPTARKPEIARSQTLDNVARFPSKIGLFGSNEFHETPFLSNRSFVSLRNKHLQPKTVSARVQPRLVGSDRGCWVRPRRLLLRSELNDHSCLNNPPKNLIM